MRGVGSFVWVLLLGQNSTDYYCDFKICIKREFGRVHTYKSEAKQSLEDAPQELGSWIGAILLA